MNNKILINKNKNHWELMANKMKLYIYTYEVLRITFEQGILCSKYSLTL